MSKASIVNSIRKFGYEIAFQAKKHSPTILMVAGITGIAGSMVMACKATTKAVDLVEEHKHTVECIHICMEDESLKKEYSEEDAKKELTGTYVQTGLKLAKLYAPSVILATISVTSMVASNNILRKRNVALAAAYATVDKSFKVYRDRVVDRFGEEVDRQLKHGIKAKEILENVTDENGEVKEVKTVKQYIDPDDVSGYARFFEEFTRDEEGNVIKNPYWDINNNYNLLFLKSRQNYFNDLLRVKKRVFLNEVYEGLGLPRTFAGQQVGWVYNPEKPTGDNYIDFGIYASEQNYSDFVYGKDAILLDFNVDGVILDSMKIRI